MFKVIRLSTKLQLSGQAGLLASIFLLAKTRRKGRIRTTHDGPPNKQYRLQVLESDPTTPSWDCPNAA